MATSTESNDEMRLPCPSCPDGNEWGRDGPTGRACKTCNGRAYIVPGDWQPDGGIGVHRDGGDV